MSLLMLASCNKNEPVLLSVTPAVIGEVPSDVMDIRQIMKESDNLFTLTWMPAEFLANDGSIFVAPIIYNVEFDVFGKGFSNAKAYSIIQGDAHELDIPVSDFGSWVLTNISGAKGGEAIDLEIRIKAQYGDGENFVYSSNAKKITIIPYGQQPMYLVGEWNEWDTSDATYRMFKESNESDNYEYVYTGKMKGSFKLIGKDALGTEEMYYVESEGKLAVGVHEGDAIIVPSEGYYTITVDLSDMSYTFSSYNIAESQTMGQDFTSRGIGFIGDFNGWGGDIPLTQSAYDPHLWYVTADLPTGGYAKWRTLGGWDGKWCPIENNMPYGLSDYNPTAHDNCIVPAAGTYLLILNDMTGHYIAEPVE